MNVRYAAALLVLAGIMSACQAATDVGTSTPRASEDLTPGSLPPSSGEPTHNASPGPSLLALDAIVEAIVPDLRVRKAPGLSGEALGTLPVNAQSLVVDGPVSIDGYTWYAVQALGLPRSTGCEEPFLTDPYNCPSWFGWVAAHGPDGSRWLTEAELECGAWPDPQLTDEFNYGLPYLAYLACFGGDERRVVGFYPRIPDDAGLGGMCGGVPHEIDWLACNLGYEFLVADRADGYFGSPFILAVPPDIEMPARGQWIEVTGHYDDPAAQRCDYERSDDLPAERTITLCRGQFVVISAQPVSR